MQRWLQVIYDDRLAQEEPRSDIIQHILTCNPTRLDTLPRLITAKHLCNMKSLSRSSVLYFGTQLGLVIFPAEGFGLRLYLS